MENVIKTPSMSFGEALKTCFKKYATFSGRARRSEFWWFSVLNWLLSIAAYAATFYLLIAVIGIIGLLLLLPSLAVTVRRLHDTGKSGWWLLAMIIPIVNFVIAIILLIYYLKDSDRNPNKFGPSPKYIVREAVE